MQDATQFEHPLSERLRFFLRLEYLFALYDHAKSGDSAQDSHTALRALLDVMEVISRVDIKTETIKELERINIGLSKLKDSPQVEAGMLDSILHSLTNLKSKLHTITGPIDQDLKKVDFLKILQQKNTVAGGMTDTDTPQYRYWLSRPAHIRAEKLQSWINTFEPLQQAVTLILQLIRESAVPSEQLAQNGLYKHVLEGSQNQCQLVVVTLPQDTDFYTEFSGNKHRFTIRFLDTTVEPRAMQATTNIPFLLSCCSL